MLKDYCIIAIEMLKNYCVFAKIRIFDVFFAFGSQPVLYFPD